jgi:hypothetical protein
LKNKAVIVLEESGWAIAKIPVEGTATTLNQKDGG